MANKHKLHIVRRIMVRLARIYHVQPHYWSIISMAAEFMSWDRSRREAWIAARYDDLTAYLGFSEEDLAIAIT